jgi:hypothetical protein
MATPIPVLVMVSLLAAASVASFAIRGSVIGSGGPSSPPAANSTYHIVGTAGQPAVDMVGEDATVVCNGFWCISGSPEVDIDPTASDLPKVFAFVLLSPNPTHGGAQWELELPRAAQITFRVFDVGGRQIGEPISGRLEAGRRRLIWNTDLQPAGLYFIRLTTDAGFKATRKIVLVR